MAQIWLFSLPFIAFSPHLWELSRDCTGENLHLSLSFGGRLSPGGDPAKEEKSQESYGQTGPHCGSTLSQALLLLIDILVLISFVPSFSKP